LVIAQWFLGIMEQKQKEIESIHVINMTENSFLLVWRNTELVQRNYCLFVNGGYR